MGVWGTKSVTAALGSKITLIQIRSQDKTFPEYVYCTTMKNLRVRSPGKLYFEILTLQPHLGPLSKSSQRVVVAAFYRRDRL